MRYFNFPRLLLLIALTTALILTRAQPGFADPPPCTVYLPVITVPKGPMAAQHVILMIGDGMGAEEIKAAGMYLYGAPGTLSFENKDNFPYQSLMSTYSASFPINITDSAASATAMATGHKVTNGVISQSIPDDSTHAYGCDLPTVMEYARAHRYSVGLVTTAAITDATPAAFGAHTAARANWDEITNDYFTGLRPHILYGGGGNGMTQDAALAASFQVVTDAPSLNALNLRTPIHISGQFGAGAMPYEFDGIGSLPRLSEMTLSALAQLNQDPDGFFLMIEGGNIDHAGHINDLERQIGEMQEFSHTVQVVRDWASSHPNTLILVLADHETGGLTVIANNGQGILPTVAWLTTWHTGVDVPVYLYSDQPVDLPGKIDNTDVPGILSSGQFLP